MLVALLLEVSLFVAPMFLDETAPPTRSVRTILIAHDGVPGASATLQRTHEEAAKLAGEVAAKLRAGASFEALAKTYSSAWGDGGGVLGTFFPHVLAPELDHFLFASEIGAVSDPIESSAGFHVLQRIERDAACLQILIAGTDEESRRTANGLLEKLRAGAEFAELAKQHSADELSAKRGGQLAIFERGPSDRLIKADAFELHVGELGGPFPSPLGWHILKRVPVAEVDPSLRDDVTARVRAILVAFGGARGADPRLVREHDDAEALALSLVKRIRAGEDMAALAREYDDDHGGRERSGDLGWIRRRSPQVSDVVERVFLSPKGPVLDPIATNAGWLILRRER